MEVDLKNSGEEYNTLKVKAFYSKGGINYYNYENEERGMYVRVSATHISYDGIFKVEKFKMFDENSGSFKFKVLDMKRNSKKKVGEFNAAIDGVDGDEIVKFFEEGNKKAIVDIISAVLGVPVLVAA